jgi:hypothetical protein
LCFVKFIKVGWNHTSTVTESCRYALWNFHCAFTARLRDDLYGILWAGTTR